MTKDGYTITCTGYFGDYKADTENIVLHMSITFLDGSQRKEMRYTKSNKKGIARTSMYGIKVKVNLDTLEVIAA